MSRVFMVVATSGWLCNWLCVAHRPALVITAASKVNSNKDFGNYNSLKPVSKMFAQVSYFCDFTILQYKAFYNRYYLKRLFASIYTFQ